MDNQQVVLKPSVSNRRSARPSQAVGDKNRRGDKKIMLKEIIMCLLIAIFTMACAASGIKKQAAVRETAAESAAQLEPSSGWRPFKGVLLRHIIANCCFSDTQNTVVLGQDNNGNQKVDKCYQLKGKDGKINYRTIECPDILVPVAEPKRDGRLQCRY